MLVEVPKWAELWVLLPVSGTLRKLASKVMLSIPLEEGCSAGSSLWQHHVVNSIVPAGHQD